MLIKRIDYLSYCWEWKLRSLLGSLSEFWHMTIVSGDRESLKRGRNMDSASSSIAPVFGNVRVQILISGVLFHLVSGSAMIVKLQHSTCPLICRWFVLSKRCWFLRSGKYAEKPATHVDSSCTTTGELEGNRPGRSGSLISLQYFWRWWSLVILCELVSKTDPTLVRGTCCRGKPSAAWLLCRWLWPRKSRGGKDLHWLNILEEADPVSGPGYTVFHRYIALDWRRGLLERSVEEVIYPSTSSVPRRFGIVARMQNTYLNWSALGTTRCTFPYSWRNRVHSPFCEKVTSRPCCSRVTRL